ncbi:hypothetical protein [Sorangium sp. So ce341]|uniref:hypothetical protein n=1 Tax=Sorangium sp. So ce341 TaxID=3133302 RepID=UPI003F5F4F24
MRAGHGYADPAFRPSDLPFVSVLGPMAVELHAERETTKPPVVLLQLPGYVVSARRETPTLVPAGGALRLRFDGRGAVTLAGLPQVQLGDAAACAAFAADVEQRIRNAVTLNAVTDIDGNPLLGEDDLADIAKATCRFDADSSRFAVSSGRRGVVEVMRSASGPRASTVEVLPVANDIAGPLGLRDGTVVGGRLVRHQLPAPRAINMDVRLELWAASQPELASVADHLIHVAPSRGAVRTLPALLSRSGADGDTALALLPAGEPTARHSLAHVEAGGGAVDRVTGRSFSPALTPSPAKGRFVLTGADRSMSLGVWPTPLVPSPLDADHPAPRGLSLSLSLALGAGGGPGDEVQACALRRAGAPVLVLTLRKVQLQGNKVGVDLEATATFRQPGGVTSTATTVMRVPLASVEKGIQLHATVVAVTGLIELYVDGEPQLLTEPAQTPSPPVAGVGAVDAGTDMTLTLGSPAQSPLALEIGHAHLLSEPFGPLDPALRGSVTRAQRFAPGQRIQLARPGGRAEERASFTVVSVANDAIEISPALRGAWPAGQTSVFAEEHFFEQVSLKRRDDLANRLFRISGDYRVSAFLDQLVAQPPVPVVETPEVEMVTRLGSAGPATEAVGVRPHVA